MRCPDISFTTELIGYCAAFCTTFAFLPQVIRTWRTKSAHDLSLATILAFMTGISLWFIYGVSVGARPIMAANLVTFSLQLSLLYLKLRYGRRRAGKVQP
ncbi:MAG: SemiSWEET family sugar transporter [Pseudanabaenaceae cyanobacterium]